MKKRGFVQKISCSGAVPSAGLSAAVPPRRGRRWGHRRYSSAALVAATLLFFLAAAGCAQQVATGFPPFSSFGGGQFDTVNNTNLNVHFTIPVIGKAGRGLPFYYFLAYDSSVWSPPWGTGYSTWVP